MPSGHVEQQGEPVVYGAVREAREEIGVRIDPQDLVLAHMRDRNAEDGHRMDFFFLCERWQGAPVNLETHKCSELRWIADDENEGLVIPYVAEVVKSVFRKSNYSLEDWE